MILPFIHSFVEYTGRSKQGRRGNHKFPAPCVSVRAFRNERASFPAKGRRGASRKDFAVLIAVFPPPSITDKRRRQAVPFDRSCAIFPPKAAGRLFTAFPFLATAYPSTIPRAVRAARLRVACRDFAGKRDCWKNTRPPVHAGHTDYEIVTPLPSLPWLSKSHGGHMCLA